MPTVRSLYSLLLGCILLAGGGAAEAGTISIEWDPIPGAQEYRVHYGSESGNYSKVHKVGNATQTRVMVSQGPRTEIDATTTHSSAPVM